MNCEAVRERLALWAGGDLPPDELVAVEDHLAGCGACRAEADAWRADRERIIELAKMDAGPELEPSRLEQMIAEAEQAAGGEAAPAPTRVFWRWAGPVAALLAVFLFWRLVPLPAPREDSPRAEAQGAANWEQLQAAFDGCLATPIAPSAWRAETGPGLIAVLTRQDGRYILADCIETPDLERISRYPWLEQRLERYRRQGDGKVYLAVCESNDMDRSRRRALRRQVLERFGQAGGPS